MQNWRESIEGSLLPGMEVPDRVRRELRLIESHLEAFSHFKEDNIELALRKVFSLGEVTHLPKFEKALKEVLDMRKKLGLSIPE